MSAISFEYAQRAQKVVFARDAISTLGSHLDDLGVQRAFVFCDPNVQAKTTVLDRVKSALGAKLVGIFNGIQPHSPIDTCIQGAEEARRAGADVIISVGGGSAHDTVKGSVILLAEGGRLQDHRVIFEPPDKLYVPPLSKPKLPIITIPTTLAGAEMTPAAGITDKETLHKTQYLDYKLAPRVVIYDVLAALTTPPFVILASGMNTMNHCVEVVYSSRHEPITDALALGAMSLLIEFLPRCAEHNEEAIQKVQVAAVMAILAVTNTWLGINHAIGHCLGARYGVLHGVASSLILPHGMRFNLDATADQQVLIARVFGIDTENLSAIEAGALAADAVADFSRKLGMPQRLRDVGVGEDGLEPLAKDTMRDRQMYHNPKPVADYRQVLDVLRSAW